MNKMTIAASLFFLIPLLLAAGPAGWHADPAIVASLTKDRPDVVYDESKVPPYVLPDVMLAGDGSRITTIDQWSKRRTELLELFRSQMYGRVPDAPVDVKYEVLSEDPHALNGAATLRRVAIHVACQGREHSFTFALYLPNGVKKPAPVLLLIDNRGHSTTRPARPDLNGFWPVEEIIGRGFGTASFYTSDVAPDNAQHFREGVIRVFEGDRATRPADAWGAIGAWAWGASRVMDYLANDPRVDPGHVAIIGHSRGGKTALWAAAQDDRFAAAYANASGCGGSSIARRKFGETVARINQHFPYWFCENYKRYNDRENDLPFDQHELVALIAPRPVYFAAMTNDLWADPHGSFLTLSAASPVYALWGESPFPADPMPPVGEQLIAGNRGWHMHEGKHDLILFDWQKFMDFTNQAWKLRH